MKILLIDINGIGYASMYTPAFAKLTHNGEPTGSVHGTLNSVLNICGQATDAVPIVLWDGHSEWRRELHSEYKSNRTDDPKKIAIKEAYKKQVPHIKKLLESYGICQIEHATAEADDLAGIIVRNAAPDVEIVLVSDDTDWWQTLRNNVVWFAPRNDRLLRLEDLNDSEKCSDGPFESVDEYIMAKAMAGDSSDNIDGIPGVGLKTGVKLLRTFGSIENLWTLHDKGEAIKGEVAKRVAGPEFREIYKRNLKLIDWRLAPPLDNSTLIIKDTPRDVNKFMGEAADIGLTKVTKLGKDLSRSIPDIANAAQVKEFLYSIFGKNENSLTTAAPVEQAVKEATPVVSEKTAPTPAKVVEDKHQPVEEAPQVVQQVVKSAPVVEDVKPVVARAPEPTPSVSSSQQETEEDRADEASRQRSVLGAEFGEAKPKIKKRPFPF